MIQEIKIYNNDVIRFDNKFCYSEDNYKYGRFYEVATIDEVAEFIATEPKKIIAIADMKDREGYVIGECSHSNGWTTDFVIRIGNHIYIASYVQGSKCSGINISIAYNINTHSFEMDKYEDAIVSDEDDKIICDYADKNY